MRGHDDIAEYRRAGGRPRMLAVSIADVPVVPGGDGMNENGHGFITVEHTDVPAKLDFRCVVGLPVIVCADGGDRWLEVVDRISQFKPTSILASAGNYWAVWTLKHGLKELGE